MHEFWTEPTVNAGCLYLVLEKLITLAGRIIFQIAFASLIFVQFVFVVLLLWGLSEIISGDNYFEVGILAILLLASPFLIGANSYFMFQRFTRAQYTLAESKRWLADRNKWNAHQIGRRNQIRRWIMWAPALSVLLFCLFLDETWPPTSHLFHPIAGRLAGYSVPVPLAWAIVLSEPDSNSHAYSSVWAFRSRRVFRGSIEFFLGGRPSVSVSSMSFYGNPPSEDIQSPSWRRDSKLPIATRELPVGNTLLKCEEFALANEQQNGQLEIRCTTQRRELTGFTGNQNDSAAFYRTVQNIKKR